MKQDARGLFSRLISTRHFLFSRLSAPPEAHPHDFSSLPAADPLMQTFPEALIGEVFAAAALEKAADWQSFGVMAMYLEFAPDPADTPQSLSSARLALARLLVRLSHNGGGVWGVLDHRHLACLLPGDSLETHLESAAGIQKALSADGLASVTVGVAIYPMAGFEREEILGNAFKALDHAEFFGPGSCVAFDAVSLNISGDKRYDAGDIEGAAKEYRKGLLIDPENVNLHNSLGVCYGVQGELDSALEEFAEATRLDESEVMAVYNTGLVYTLRQETEEGLVHLKKAETLDSCVFEVALELGKVYLDAGDHPKSKEYLEKARALDPRSSAVFFLLGECCCALELQKEAVSAYQSAIKFDPDNAAALSALGWLYHQRNENRDIALLFCEQSVKIAPETPLFCFRLGRLYLAHGRMEDALAALQTAGRLGHDVDADLTEIRQLTAGEGLRAEGQD
jgi:tetratricopeptide (TPR) repeat protein